MDKYIHYKVWDEITYPFLNIDGTAFKVWEWISYLSMLGFKLIHVSKMSPKPMMLYNILSLQGDFVCIRNTMHTHITYSMSHKISSSL